MMTHSANDLVSFLVLSTGRNRGRIWYDRGIQNGQGNLGKNCSRRLRIDVLSRS